MRITKIINSIDQKLGRIVSRLCALLAFAGALGSTVFGTIVLLKGHIVPGTIALLLGGFFSWLGLHAWRDRAAFGELLNRDYSPVAGVGVKSDGKENRNIS